MALDDLTVLDLSHALAGPFATTLLADYGAEVIKIEAPDAGDMARAWGPPFYDDESAYFVNLHRNKKSVEIDLKHAEGRELFFRLLDTRRHRHREPPHRDRRQARARLRTSAQRAARASSTARSPDSARMVRIANARRSI